jgi:hypothetical protein
MPTNQPMPSPFKTAKGTRRSFEVSAVLWIDLLGYGTALAAAEWDPSAAAAAAAAVERLHTFHAIADEHSNRHFRVSALNDAIVATKDLSPRARGVTSEFFRRAIKLHRAINTIEHSKGLPGARAVLAAGFRMRRRYMTNARPDLNLLLERMHAGRISAEQAIRQAVTLRPYSGLIPELQANFAFSRAYLADASGSSAGLGGPKFYLGACWSKAMQNRSTSWGSM